MHGNNKKRLARRSLFAVIFCTIAICSPLSFLGAARATPTEVPPGMPWGVSIGESYEFEWGVDLNLSIPDAVYQAIDTFILNATDTVVNSKSRMQDSFALLPSNERMNVTITNITGLADSSQGDFSYTDRTCVSWQNQTRCVDYTCNEYVNCCHCSEYDTLGTYNCTYNTTFQNDRIHGDVQFYSKNNQTWVHAGPYFAEMLESWVLFANETLFNETSPDYYSQADIDALKAEFAQVNITNQALMDFLSVSGLYDNCTEVMTPGIPAVPELPFPIPYGLDSASLLAFLFVPSTFNMSAWFNMGSAFYTWWLESMEAQDYPDCYYCGANPLADLPTDISSLLDIAGLETMYIEPTLLAMVFNSETINQTWLEGYLEDFIGYDPLSLYQPLFNASQERAGVAVNWGNKGVMDYLALYNNITGVLNGTALSKEYGGEFPDIGLQEISASVKIYLRRAGVTEPTFADIVNLNLGMMAQVLPAPGTSDIKTPDAKRVIPLASGTNRVNFKKGSMEMRLDVNTKRPTSVVLENWVTPPAGDEVAGINVSHAVFFGISVADEDAIIFPMNLTISLPFLPLDILNKTDQEIARALGIMTYNENSGKWVPTGFPITVNKTAGTATVQITHLSVFALGISTPNTLDIPGYPVGISILSILGAVVLLTRRNRQQR